MKTRFWRFESEVGVEDTLWVVEVWGAMCWFHWESISCWNSPGMTQQGAGGEKDSLDGQHRRWGLPEVESVHLGSLAELWEMGEVRHLDEPASAILGGATRLANRWGCADTSRADYWCTGTLFWGGLELLRLEASGCCGWRRSFCCMCI